MQSSTEKQVKRSLENVERQLKGINDWQSWLASDEGKNYARPEEEELLFKQINEIVDKNIFYGSPPYSLEGATEILDDIINDLVNLKERTQI